MKDNFYVVREDEEMIKIKPIAKCQRCGDMAKINEIKIVEREGREYLGKDYICDCGGITTYLDIIKFTMEN